MKMLKRKNMVIAGVTLGFITAMGLNLHTQAAAPKHNFEKYKKKYASSSKKNKKHPQNNQKTTTTPPKVLSQDKSVLPNTQPTLSWEQDFTKMAPGRPSSVFWNIAKPTLPIYNHEQQVYSDQPDNVRIEDGVLVLEARKQDNSYTSGRVDTLNLKNIEINSRLEARLKLPKGKGTWPAFWLLSANQPYTTAQNPTDTKWQQPRFYMWDGEIDIMEAYGTYPGMVEATTHTFAATKEGTNKIPDASDAFHTYWFEWRADKLVFGVDNTTYFTHQKTSNSAEAWPFTSDNKYYVILNLAMGGSGGSNIVQAAGDNWRMEVASVKYYKL